MGKDIKFLFGCKRQSKPQDKLKLQDHEEEYLKVLQGNQRISSLVTAANLPLFLMQNFPQDPG